MTALVHKKHLYVLHFWVPYPVCLHIVTLTLLWFWYGSKHHGYNTFFSKILFTSLVHLFDSRSVLDIFMIVWYLIDVYVVIKSAQWRQQLLQLHHIETHRQFTQQERKLSRMHHWIFHSWTSSHQKVRKVLNAAHCLSVHNNVGHIS